MLFQELFHSGKRKSDHFHFIFTVRFKDRPPECDYGSKMADGEQYFSLLPDISDLG